jgi:predicted YcjX-like family ATPase
MDLEKTKSWVEIAKGLAEFGGIIYAAAATYGAFLLSSRPRLCIDIIVHWPPGKLLKDGSAFSVQFRYFNPAMGSQVVTEMEVDRLIVEQIHHRQRCSLSPYTVLKPLILLEDNKVQEFEAKVQELVHPVIMVGQGQELQHLAFVPDFVPDQENNIFALTKGIAHIRLRLKYTIYNLLLRLFREPSQNSIEIKYYYKNEARQRLDETWGCLGRDLHQL